jgi:hypothetical protein
VSSRWTWCASAAALSKAAFAALELRDASLDHRRDLSVVADVAADRERLVADLRRGHTAD